jgi:hypothetical protein
MNTTALNKLLTRWKAASKRTHSANSVDAFWAGKDKERMLPDLIEAWTTQTPTDDVTRLAVAFDDEDDANRKDFDYYCIPSTPAMFALIELSWKKFILYKRHIWQRKGLTLSADDIAEYRVLVAGAISAVVNAELTDPTIEGVTFSRTKAWYSIRSRYRPLHVNRRFLPVIDGLSECGLFQQVRGQAWRSQTRPEGGVDKSLIRSTRTLRNLMADCHVTSPLDSTWDRTGQEIIRRKKDKTSALDEYSDLDVLANGYRLEMQHVNELLWKTNILVINREGLPFIDVRDRFLQRQFTYASWTSGGRLLGGFWTPMSKLDRRERLLLNGERTVELDYNSIPYHALYASVKATPPNDDVYSVAGINPASRSGLKTLMLALTFDKKPNRRKFPKGSGDKFTKADRAKGARKIIELIKTHHRPIAHLLGDNRGHGLQFIESQVIVAVLLQLKQEGLIGLPVHDCLVVPISQADRISTIMQSVSLKITGCQIPSHGKLGIATH